MARGRFGHRPRPSGNLTSLIVQLYREQKAAEDRVMFDAYQNGGKGIDGKPVTDAAIRKYIAGRRDSFTQDDPLYSEWNNRLIQIDFKIGEEKVGLAYKQGKVGAGAVAAYYRHQLAHIPQDSEFYRTVAGRAADWAKAAAGAARSAARSRLTKALEAKQNGVQKLWDNYSSLEGILTDAAKRAGLIAGNQTLTDADASDLEAFLHNGVAGPHGTKITFADWQHSTVSAYKAFDTLIGINKQLGRGTKTLTKQKGEFLEQNLVRVNTVDDRAKYELARDAFMAASKDANGDPRKVLDAAQTYAATLSSIKASASKSKGTAQVDAEFIGGLTNEISALTTGKASGSSVADLQSTTGEGTPTSDLQDTADSIAKATADVKALANGDAFFGQTEFGGGFKVQYYPPGAKLDPFGKNGLDASFQPSVVNIDGEPTEVVLKGQPVQAFGLTDAQGNPVTNIDINGKAVPIENLTAGQINALVQSGYKRTDDPTTVGYVFTDAGGKNVKYGVVQSDGSIQYTTVNPFGSSLTPAGDNGFVMFTGSDSNPNTGKPQPTVPPFKLANADSFLADEGITPKDLLALAADPKNAALAPQLTAMADKRKSEADAENAYQRHAPKSNYNPISAFIGDALTNVQDTILSAADVAGGTISQGVPNLPGLGPVLSTPSGPPQDSPLGKLSPVKPPAPLAPPPSTPPPSKKVGTEPKPPPAPGTPESAAGAGSAVGGAVGDIIDQYTKPKPPPSGGSTRPKPE